ncbi:hypothetical protein GCM10009715_21570 [Paeniglutamicibacter psychrophenolicus]
MVQCGFDRFPGDIPRLLALNDDPDLGIRLGGDVHEPGGSENHGGSPEKDGNPGETEIRLVVGTGRWCGFAAHGLNRAYAGVNQPILTKIE